MVSLTEILWIVEVANVLDLVSREVELLQLHERDDSAEAELQLDVRQLGLDHALLRQLVHGFPRATLLSIRSEE